MLLSKKKHVASAAVHAVINGYLYSHADVVKNPELLPKKYIMKMIKAISKMQHKSDMGYLVQDLAQIAPAYGLMDELFKAAKANLAKNPSLIEYALENMVKYGNVCLFKYVKEYTKEHKDVKALKASCQATNELLKKKHTAKHIYQMCKCSDKFLPAKFNKEIIKHGDFKTLGYRYFDVVTTCKRYQAVNKVKMFKALKNKDLDKKIDQVTEKLKVIKKALQDAQEKKNKKDKPKAKVKAKVKAKK
jgi:hypothetical protein